MKARQLAKKTDWKYLIDYYIRAHNLALERAKAIRSQHSTGRKLQQATGFRPGAALEEGLSATAEWYRARFAPLRKAQPPPSFSASAGALT